jgi:pilus assembly protein CpaB
VNLKRNESILESKLAPISITTGGVSAVTDPAKRAMAVKVDEVVGVAGFIKPGDRVDVMVTINPSRSGESVLAKLVLSNTLVLATGTETERKGGNEKATPVTVITLEVTPEEAEKLALSTTEGKLRLALRNPMNTDVALTKGATINSLLSSYRVFEKPEKAQERSKKLVEPKADNKVEIIKGGTVTSVKFGHEM